jgi:hypothetical protein
MNGLDSLPRPDPDRRYDPILVALAAEPAVLGSRIVQGLPATRPAPAILMDTLDAARLAMSIPSVVQADSAR